MLYITRSIGKCFHSHSITVPALLLNFNFDFKVSPNFMPIILLWKNYLSICNFFKKMVRNYVRKGSAPFPSEEMLQRAVTEVIEKRMSLRAAAEHFHLAKSTVADYVRKVRLNGNVVPNKLKRSQHSRQMFSAAFEKDIADYLERCSLTSHGLTPLAARKLAYSFAVTKGVPPNWKSSEAASHDWFSAFLKRNLTFSIRVVAPKPVVIERPSATVAVSSSSTD